MPPNDTPAPCTSTASVNASLEMVDCAHALQAPMDVDHQLDNSLSISTNTGLTVASAFPYSTLLNLDLWIEPNLQIIYCITCQEAIKPTSVRGHILTHLRTCPPNDKLQEIFSEYNLDGKVRMPSAPITQIPGLRHGKGYKCLECGFLRPSTHSIRTHCRDAHPGNPKEFLETTAHIIYKFRRDMVLVETNPDLDGLPQGSTYEAYRAARPVQPNSTPIFLNGALATLVT
jgi:Zn ribbon nucleic-acid-binding protein